MYAPLLARSEYIIRVLCIGFCVFSVRSNRRVEGGQLSPLVTREPRVYKGMCAIARARGTSSPPRSGLDEKSIVVRASPRAIYCRVVYTGVAITSYVR